MSPKTTSLLLRGVVLTLLLIIILLCFTEPVKAGNGDNPTNCEFQPPAADRKSTLDSIYLYGPGNGNISWDNTYLGLHRWNGNQWPGVDYLVPTTVIFKNGGYVDKILFDTYGGGNSIFIRGTGPCEGWYEFIGHLNYDPSTRYTVGQYIGPNEVVGEPGCSYGDEAFCVKDGGSLQPHNHESFGYQSNLFSYSDGTQIVNAGGYWWIHPSRVEGLSTTKANTNLEQTIPDNSHPENEFSFTFAMPEPKTSIDISFSEKVLKTLLPYRNIIIVVFALISIVFVGKLIYSGEFRKLALVSIIIGVLFAVCFVGVNQVIAQSDIFSPPRQTEFSVATSEEMTTFELDPVTEESAPENTAPTLQKAPPKGDCSLSGFPESIRQWCGYIEKYAAQYQVDPHLIASVMLQESGGDPRAYSSSGAVGLMQIMPRDGISANFMCANGPCFGDRPSIEELYDAEFNISYGARMLSGLITRNGGNERDALLAYGPMDVGYYYADLVLNIRATRK